MGKANKTPGAQKPQGSDRAADTPSLRRFLVGPLDLPAGPPDKMADEVRTPTDPEPSLHTSSHAEAPTSVDPAVWLPLLRNLPTKSDLKEANAELRSSIMAELQHVRHDIQGLTHRVDTLEQGSDSLRLAQEVSTSVLQLRSTQLRNIALHIADLDNRGRRNNLRLRGLPETETSADQLTGMLLSIFNTLLDRPESSAIDFVRAHRALRPKGTTGSPPRDVICCLYDYGLKEDIMRKAREATQFSYEGTELQLYPDLSPATLAYRRALKPLTSLLRDQQLRYRWHTHTVLSDQGTFILQSPEDVATLSTDLQLPPLQFPWSDPLALYNQ
uniref:Uncharacterized protein n=1 Tax=Leptobrachium leishanense TaxID=445787 RepID=A0A8C5Q612_9ANUR